MDRHIDNSETQKYGPQLRHNMTVLTKGSVPKTVRAFVLWCIAAQAKVDADMARAMERMTGANVDMSEAKRRRAPAEKTARTILSAFADHLRSKKKLGEWSGDLRTFFPRPLKSAQGPRQTKAAVEAAIRGLAGAKAVPEGAAYKRRLNGVLAKLTKEIVGATGAYAERLTTLSEQSREKKAWLATYRPLGAIADGLLALLNLKTKKRATLVPHRAAPGPRGAKKKAAVAAKKPGGPA